MTFFLTGLSILFDLPDMVEDVVHSIEDGAVLAIISGSLKEVKSKLDAAATEIGIASIKL